MVAWRSTGGCERHHVSIVVLESFAKNPAATALSHEHEVGCKVEDEAFMPCEP